MIPNKRKRNICWQRHPTMGALLKTSFNIGPPVSIAGSIGQYRRIDLRHQANHRNHGRVRTPAEEEAAGETEGSDRHQPTKGNGRRLILPGYLTAQIHHRTFYSVVLHCACFSFCFACTRKAFPTMRQSRINQSINQSIFSACVCVCRFLLRRLSSHIDKRQGRGFTEADRGDEFEGNPM